jgi:thiol:disulfide interchange protein
MNRNTRAAFVLLMVGIGALVCDLIADRSGRGGKDAIAWRADLTAARAEAARTHRPLFIDFSAGWCGPCQEMRRTTFSDPAVAAALSDKIPVSIDIDQHGDVAQQFGVTSIPTLVLFSERGVAIKSTSGFMSSDEFVAWLKSN